MKGIEFHPEARRDLDEIWEYIRNDSVDAADRVIAQVLARVEGLVEFPNQGHKHPDRTSRPLRFVIVRQY